MKPIHWFFLALVIYTFWAFDVCQQVFVNGLLGGNYLAVVFLGICVGQIQLIGAWGALARGKLVVRLPCAVLLSTLMWLAIRIGQTIEGTYSNPLELGIMIGFGVVAAHIPLWFVRRRFRWRLVLPRLQIEELEQETQFNLKELFLAMFLASLALVAARFALADVEFQEFKFARSLYVVLPVTAICNTLVVAPCIWIAFNRDRLFVWAAAWIPCVVLVSVVELFMLSPVSQMPTNALGLGFVVFVSSFNIAQCFTVLGTMLLWRWLGVRLIQVKPVVASQETTLAN